MNIKKLAGTIVCSVALVAGGFYFLTPSKVIKVEAKVKGYENVAALEKEAEYIVVGHLEKNFSEYEPTFNYTSVGRVGEFYTKTDIIIDKSLKGDTDTKVIPVLQAAAYVESSSKYQDVFRNNRGLYTYGKRKRVPSVLKKSS